MASRSDYGANPNAGVNVNADHGWGGYQWPAGVPSNLLCQCPWSWLEADSRNLALLSVQGPWQRVPPR